MVSGGNSNVSKGGTVLLAGGKGTTRGDVELEGARLAVNMGEEVEIISSGETRVEASTLDLNALVVEVGYHSDVSMRLENTIKQMTLTLHKLVVEGTDAASHAEINVPNVFTKPVIFGSAGQHAPGFMSIAVGAMTFDIDQLGPYTKSIVEHVKVDGIQATDQVVVNPTFSLGSNALMWSAWAQDGAVYVRVINVGEDPVSITKAKWNFEVRRTVCYNAEDMTMVQSCEVQA